ncbi:MAG: hypothetical protein GY839_07830 [candidate division Zixibacteria bacterium]|nr:hypothetical protein [candidate division Zixibacteria bacterium]
MNNSEDVVNNRIKNPIREDYEVLIELIDNSLIELHRDRNRLLPESCEGLFLHFNELLHEDDIRKNLSKNKWVLEQISERNCERHKQLVKLLTKRFELNRALNTDPKGASAIIKSLKIQDEIEEINAQIDFIIEISEKEIETN